MMVSEAEETTAGQFNVEVNVPTYDDIHKKKRSTVSFADMSVASPKKPLSRKNMNSSFGGTSKRNQRNSVLDKTSSKRPSKVSDPYELSISPKVSRKFTSFSKQMKKKSYGSKRRSRKLFSDDSDVEEETKPSTPLPDYSIAVNNGGDSCTKKRADSSHYLSSTLNGDPTTSFRRTKKPQNVKESQKFLEHVSGVLDMYARSQEGVARKVMMDIAFYITEKNDVLAMQ